MTEVEGRWEWSDRIEARDRLLESIMGEHPGVPINETMLRRGVEHLCDFEDACRDTGTPLACEAIPGDPTAVSVKVEVRLDRPVNRVYNTVKIA